MTTVRVGVEVERAASRQDAKRVDAQADQHQRHAELQPQRHLLAELHDTGLEPAFDLINIPTRPLVATINFRSPPDQRDQVIVALADRCFAASYFRYHGLA